MKSFNYTEHIFEVIRHICDTQPTFAHVRCNQLLVGYSPARLSAERGLYAKIIPMKFEDGSDTVQRGRYTYRMPELTCKGHQILYVIYFCMPKFANLKFDTKLNTIIHELYHISPLFNGDIRRFPGPKFAHGYSMKKYAERVNWIRMRYIASCDGYQPFDFLNYNLEQLEEKYGCIVANRIKQPKPIRVQP